MKKKIFPPPSLANCNLLRDPYRTVGCSDKTGNCFAFFSTEENRKRVSKKATRLYEELISNYCAVCYPENETTTLARVPFYVAIQA